VRTTITPTEYRQAFITWLDVTNSSYEDKAIVAAALDYALDYAPPVSDVTVQIERICDRMRNWARDKDDVSHLALSIEKSCLLDRLIYGGEPLRTERCPKHKGRWSGCVPDPCPICSYGSNVTGWKRQEASA
jgi:hypothetical protein